LRIEEAWSQEEGWALQVGKGPQWQPTRKCWPQPYNCRKLNSANPMSRTGFSLEPPEGTQSCQHHDFRCLLTYGTEINLYCFTCYGGNRKLVHRPPCPSVNFSERKEVKKIRKGSSHILEFCLKWWGSEPRKTRLGWESSPNLLRFLLVALSLLRTPSSPPHLHPPACEHLCGPQQEAASFSIGNMRATWSQPLLFKQLSLALWLLSYLSPTTVTPMPLGFEVWVHCDCPEASLELDPSLLQTAHRLWKSTLYWEAESSTAQWPTHGARLMGVLHVILQKTQSKFCNKNQLTSEFLRASSPTSSLSD
jgi:hypothetical protein